MELKSFPAAELGAVGIAVLLSYLYWKVSRGPGAGLPWGCKQPPLQGGWVPWVGCALAFGKEPLWYIKRTHDKVCADPQPEIKRLQWPFLLYCGLYRGFRENFNVNFSACVKFHVENKIGKFRTCDV